MIIQMRKFLLLILTVFLICGPLQSQVSVKDSTIFTPLIQASYGVHMPGGDLNDRFGWNSSLGGALLFKTRKNWLFGADGYFLFGDQVDESDILSNILTNQNEVIGASGDFADIFLFQRGFSVAARFGRVFTTGKPNPNTGVFATVGVGFLQHKIRIQNLNNVAPQISGDYKKGYDRLTNGVMLTESIGYQYLGNKRLVNFFAAVELSQGFTRNRRSFNFDEMRQDEKDRLDLLYGIRIGWVLPLYKKVPKEFYYN